MPEYAPPNSNVTINGSIFSETTVDGLAIIYRKIKTLISDKTRELLEQGYSDLEIEHELQDGRVMLPTGDEVGILPLYEILSGIFESHDEPF